MTNPILQKYADALPSPEGFEPYDGYDDDKVSKAFFRSKTGTWDDDEVWHGEEIVVTVEVRRR